MQATDSMTRPRYRCHKQMRRDCPRKASEACAHISQAPMSETDARAIQTSGEEAWRGEVATKVHSQR